MKKFSRWFVAGTILAAAFGCSSGHEPKNQEEDSPEGSTESFEQRPMEEEQPASETPSSGCRSMQQRPACECSSRSVQPSVSSETVAIHPVLLDVGHPAGEEISLPVSAMHSLLHEIETKDVAVSHSLIGEVQEEVALIEALLADEMGALSNTNSSH